MEYVDFGKTGLKVSRLSIATGTHGFGGSSEQTALGLDGLANLLRLAYDHGINFWDSADGYGSHPHIARALQGIRRDSVVITTKTMSRNAQEVTQDVERFLREMKTDVLDIVLMHCLRHKDWPDRHSDAMAALSRAREQGKVRAIGVSCHDFGAFCTAADTDWVEVVLVRINFSGVNMDAEPSKVVPVIKRMYEAGKAVYGMKVLGRGKLAEDARTAIQYVFGLGTVHAVTIGISKRKHLYENLELVEEISPQNPLKEMLRF